MTKGYKRMMVWGIHPHCLKMWFFGVKMTSFGACLELAELCYFWSMASDHKLPCADTYWPRVTSKVCWQCMCMGLLIHGTLYTTVRPCHNSRLVGPTENCITDSVYSTMQHLSPQHLWRSKWRFLVAGVFFKKIHSQLVDRIQNTEPYSAVCKWCHK